MAAVNIVSGAFADVRFTVLAAQCGLADHAHALGKMSFIWKECTDRYTYVLPEMVINAILGPNGANAVVISGLGQVAEGGIRICGTQGRIEWLNNCRTNGKKGGRGKKASNGNDLFEPNEEPEAPKEEAEPALKRKVFVPPTVEEVREYCVERKNTVDPEKFVDFYTSKGWKVGKEGMTDWKACIRSTWEKDKTNTSGKGSIKVQQSTDHAAETFRKIMEEQVCPQPSQPSQQQQRLQPPPPR
jgi:hypothetical protein